MGVLIKNGTIVTAENEFRGDVYVCLLYTSRCV